MKSKFSTSFWALIVLQSYMLMFLLFHDWMKLGSFTDPVGVGSENSIGEAILKTIGNTLPTLIGFILTLVYRQKKYPLGAQIYICILYPIYMFGQFQAWWLPF